MPLNNNEMIEFEDAFRRASSGDLRAMRDLIEFWASGKNVDEGLKGIDYWLGKVKGSSDAVVLSEVGFIFHEGDESVKDSYEARDFFSKSYVLDQRIGGYSLGIFYLDDFGFERLEDAIYYFSVAADEGHYPSMVFRLLLRNYSTNPLKIFWLNFRVRMLAACIPIYVRRHDAFLNFWGYEKLHRVAPRVCYWVDKLKTW